MYAAFSRRDQALSAALARGQDASGQGKPATSGVKFGKQRVWALVLATLLGVGLVGLSAFFGLIGI